MTTTQQHHLGGLTVAILVTDGFEQIELTAPRKALEESGVIIRLLADRKGQIQGYNHLKKADLVDVDMTFDMAKADEFDAVLLPGGAINSDRIRSNTAAQRIVTQMDRQGKPIAVICHGAWLLASAGLVKGKKMTSWPSLKDDLKNAGARWIDAEVVVDGNWVSSRKPEDIPAFNAAFMRILGQRTKASVQGTADDEPAAAGTGG
jgi:protease I